MRLFAYLLIPVLMAFEAPLQNAADEARAQALMQEIRCVACENEPISQSNAEIAADMRVRVRELIADGASDHEVRGWFADRYGEFVLFRPPTSGVSGLLLWGLPFFVLLIAAFALVFSNRTRSAEAEIDPILPDAFDHDKETET